MTYMVTALLISWATGVACLLIAWPVGAERRDLSRGMGLSLRLALAMPVGVGLSSAIYFAGMHLRGSLDWEPAAYDLMALAVVGVVAWWRHGGIDTRAAPGRPAPATPPTGAVDAAHPRPSKSQRAMTVAFVIVLIAMAVLSAVSVRQQMDDFAHGAWDAWANWNYRGRFIANAGERWAHAFKYMPDAHHDYPLGLPATNARLWNYAGEFNTTAPQLVSNLMSVWTAVLVGLAVSAWRGVNQGLLAVIAMAALPFIVLHSAAQYAEPMLMCLMVASAVCTWLALGRAESADRPLLIVAGLCAGLAAWTKNEGLVFAIAGVGAAGIGSYVSASMSVTLRRLGWWLVGLAGPAAMIAWMRITLPVYEDQSHQQGRLVNQALEGEQGLVGRAFDWDRHVEVLYAGWVKVIAHPEHMVLLMLPVLAVWVGSRLRRRESAAGLIMPVILTVATIIYVLLATPSLHEMSDAIVQRYAPMYYALVLLWMASLVGMLLRCRDAAPALRGRIVSMVACPILLYVGYYWVFILTDAYAWKAAIVRLADNGWPLIVMAVFLITRRVDELSAAWLAPTAPAAAAPVQKNAPSPESSTEPAA